MGFVKKNGIASRTHNRSTTSWEHIQHRNSRILSVVSCKISCFSTHVSLLLFSILKSINVSGFNILFPQNLVWTSHAIDLKKHLSIANWWNCYTYTQRAEERKRWIGRVKAKLIHSRYTIFTRKYQTNRIRGFWTFEIASEK